MTGKEAAIQELKNLKGKPMKAKLEHILTYYWMAILAVVIVVVVLTSTIRSVFFSPETVMSGYVINASYVQSSVGEELCSDFLTEQNLNDRKHTAILFDNVNLDPYSAYAANESQALSVRISAGAVDSIATDEETFEELARICCFADLAVILPAEMIQDYANRFVYADRAVMMAWEDGTAETSDIPVGNPEGMQDPIPVGIRLTPDCRMLRSYDFKGKEAYIGIVQNTLNAETTVAFLRFVCE